MDHRGFASVTGPAPFFPLSLSLSLFDCSHGPTNALANALHGKEENAKKEKMNRRFSLNTIRMQSEDLAIQRKEQRSSPGHNVQWTVALSPTGPPNCLPARARSAFEFKFKFKFNVSLRASKAKVRLFVCFDCHGR